ncbi:MAG: TetR/AcrR family transcriptional regulator [Deltaproteobacteria bacterium]|nr:TetR/AcrR family transcriptional regulator [Deltaproteobacteria bacterium]
MEKRKMPRREREKLRQRQEMLAVSLSLFSEKGYYNVSMHEIAEKAEFAVGTLYKFFKNKDDLYRTVMLEQLGRFHDKLTKAIEEPDEELEKLRHYVRAKSEYFHENESRIRLYFAETRGSSFNVMAGLDSEFRERHYRFLQIVASVFESGMRRKRFRKIADPYHLAVALDSLTNAFLILWLEAPEHHPYPDDPDTILDILSKGLVSS